MRRLLGCLLALLLMLPSAASAFSPGAEDEGFVLVAENATRALLLEEKTMRVRLYDKETGLRWDTCVTDGKQGNKTVKNTQKSALNVTYITNAQNATTNVMDSYSKSVDPGTFVVETIENGFSVRYTIGDDAYIIDDLPKGIRADKYQKLVDGTEWTSKQKKTFSDNYRAVKLAGHDHEYMIRVKDDSLSGMLIKQLWGIIFDSGIYTQADMDEDNAAIAYEREYLPELAMTVRYQLDGGDLVVTVPGDEITFTEENEITQFELLPYFLSADTSHEGYMFVPDGSGALITLNNQKLAATSYSARVYGEDALINAAKYASPKNDIALPVFGLKREGGAMLAIIEQGAEIAGLFANVSGRSDEFNRVSTRFVLRDIESVSLAGNESITSPRFASDVYQGDIVMRYRWMPGDDVDYVDMAREYRAYLLSRGALTERAADEHAPFFLDVIGAVAKEAFFLGVPYTSSVQATTLSQAKEIYAAVRDSGVQNVKLLYSGLFYGGVKHAALTLPTLDGGMGGEQALRELSSALHENGDALYAGVYTGRAFTTRGFSRLSQAPRKHDGEPAEVYIFGEPILKREYTARKGYYVSPYYLPEYTQKALSALERYGLDGLNVLDLGNSLIGDFKRGANLSRIHATPVYQDALTALSSRYSLALDQPMLYALPYADYAVSLPSGDNGFRITDASVPFLQYVLDGCVPCAGESWNTRAYLGMEAQLLWALESKSAPRFTLTYAEPTIFDNTQDMDYMAYFSTQYERWLDTAGALYAEFDAFWQQVADARVVSHEILDAGLRRVTYDNGVTLCLNYGAEDAPLGGEVVPALSYIVQEGVLP